MGIERVNSAFGRAVYVRRGKLSVSWTRFDGNWHLSVVWAQNAEKARPAP